VLVAAVKEFQDVLGEFHDAYLAVDRRAGALRQ
jgi:CHAD domain-containing protein